MTPFQISKENKESKEHQAFHELLSGINNSKQMEDLFLEFDAKETKEAIFAYQCDLQCTVYDAEGCLDLSKAPKNSVTVNSRVSELLNSGNSWSQMWLKYDKENCPYDKNFLSVINYVIKNGIKFNHFFNYFLYFWIYYIFAEEFIL